MSEYANRLKKNARHLARWALRNAITCYRVYDCDVPSFPVIVDWYQTDKGARVHLQEVDTGWQQTDEEHQVWIEQVVAETAEVLALPASFVIEKRRVRQRVGKALDQQYQPSGTRGEALIVTEGPCRFIVDLEAYLDTGLFLDHRTSRAMIRERSAGKRFLNLFAYTGSFTVHAALGGASSSMTVDLSNTYCDWAERNLDLNSIVRAAHVVVRADVMVWLRDEVARRARYDLIVLDPPSFSNSKKMDDILDIQRDHAQLIDWCMALLEPEGELFFSNNLRTFALAPELAERYLVQDVSRRTIPDDYRDQRIHQAFFFRHRAVADATHRKD